MLKVKARKIWFKTKFEKKRKFFLRRSLRLFTPLMFWLNWEKSFHVFESSQFWRRKKNWESNSKAKIILRVFNIFFEEMICFENDFWRVTNMLLTTNGLVKRVVESNGRSWVWISLPTVMYLGFKLNPDKGMRWLLFLSHCWKGK